MNLKSYPSIGWLLGWVIDCINQQKFEDLAFSPSTKGRRALFK